MKRLINKLLGSRVTAKQTPKTEQILSYRRSSGSISAFFNRNRFSRLIISFAPYQQKKHKQAEIKMIGKIRNCRLVLSNLISHKSYRTSRHCFGHRRSYSLGSNKRKQIKKK
jgi:hypothetical protein